jgi:hypothetical protein
VIRSKLAAMIARAEAVQNWLENITYQMNNMVSDFSHPSWRCILISIFQTKNYKEQAAKLAG